MTPWSSRRWERHGKTVNSTACAHGF